MKAYLLPALFISLSAGAQTSNWTETFKLPEGMTYRARSAGFDCGQFRSTYVAKPNRFKQIEFRQLAADKDLNKFLIEASFSGTEGQYCIYGAYLDRNRSSKTLDFTHSLIKTEGEEAGCMETQQFLDLQMSSMAYEGSRRGLRYIATQIINNESNEVCESGDVRIVFDRRFQE
jgi:hypothetical protein